MGAKAWFIAYFDDDPRKILGANPKLDRPASLALARRLVPDTDLVELEDGCLSDLNPAKREMFVADYGGLRIVAHNDLSGDFPSKIAPRWRDPSLGKTAYVHATHSVVDWFAYAIWHDGELRRALSLSSDDGIAEDIGDKLPFERPYWEGKHPLEWDDDEEDTAYPFPFHPLELMEASMLEHLGFQFEGNPEKWVCKPHAIPVARFQIKRSAWWKFW